MLDFSRLRRSHWGNILIYTMLLTFFATVAAYLLFSKSETLFTNLETSRRSAKLDKNLASQADLAIKYAISLNKDWGWFTNTLQCPTDFALKNISSGGTTVATGTSTGVLIVGTLRCNGNTGTTGSDFSIEYSASGSSFTRVGYLGTTHTLSPSWLRLVGPVYTGSGGFSYQVGFTLPTVYSGIDINGNSDDRRPTSSGAIGYPLGATDNDSLGREVVYGYVRRDSGFNSIFWNNKRLWSFIAANTYNTGSLVTVPSLVSTGAIHLTIDGPYILRIEEYDRAKYLANRELSYITGSTIYSGSGGVGYIQPNLALSGQYGNTGAIATARKFDLANRDYAIFLSYSGSTYNPGADFLRYQVKASNSAGVNIAIAPLNDEVSSAYRYLANVIIFDGTGERLAKMQEIARPTGL